MIVFQRDSRRLSRPSHRDLFSPSACSRVWEHCLLVCAALLQLQPFTMPVRTQHHRADGGRVRAPPSPPLQAHSSRCASAIRAVARPAAMMLRRSSLHHHWPPNAICCALRSSLHADRRHGCALVRLLAALVVRSITTCCTRRPSTRPSCTSSSAWYRRPTASSWTSSVRDASRCQNQQRDEEKMREER